MIKKLMLFWISGILSYLAQGLFNNTETTGFLAFSINWMTVVYILKIFSIAMDWKLPFKLYNSLIGSGVLIGVILLKFNFTYQLGVSFFCLACAFSLFHAASSNRKSPQNDVISLGYRFLLLFAGLHFLDYPILRPVPEYATLGFSISLIFFFCFAAFVPTFILRKISIDYNKELKNEVEVRTKQLKASNTELSYAFDNLKLKNEQIDSILKENQSRLAVLVHDLTNPLTILFYNFGLLMSNPDKFISQLDSKSEKLKKAVNVIDLILKDARNVHANVLGKNTISLQEVSLEIIIKDVVDLFEEKLKEKNMSVEYNKDDLKKHHVLANDAWLKNHVLSNLISNAIKFSHAGGRILIRAATINGQIFLYIQDSGVGISVEKRNNLFELNQATTSVGTNGEKGTGLGLPIVKQYLELMGGKIRIVDSQTVGTCFELTLKNVA
ncbi:MAG: HAMP domain-containing sensor histidine kinase [Bdellovibrionota bacterium]